MLVLLSLALSLPSPDTSETTFFYDKTSATLSLVKYDNNYGSFENFPPNSVDANGQAKWSMNADLFHSFGWMGYDVYYKGPFEDCLDLSYLWDLAFGVCNSGFTKCPGTDGFDPKNKTRAKSTSASNGMGTYYIADDCGAESNPAHTLTYQSTPHKNNVTTTS
jgi:hypothetical protein